MSYRNIKPISPTTFVSTEISSDFNITNEDFVGVKSETPVIITLPKGSDNRRVIIKNIHGPMSGKITIAPNTTEEMIDNAEIYELTEPYESVTLIFMNHWFLI